jgi:hypothetical protein
MGQAFIYPTSADISLIEQEYLPRLQEGRIGLELFPVVTQDEDKVRWEQMDNFLGLQQVRGLNGEPNRVSRVGAKGYEMQPGYYGEFQVIDEAELTRRRKLGSFGDPIDISDLVAMAELNLQIRELDRIEAIVWTLMATGTFAVSNEQGILHTDTFPILTFTASPAWSTVATATPVADLRTIRLNQRGRSTNFGRAAKLYVNQKKVNQLLSNTNASDLGAYKKPQDGLQRTINLDDINKILLDQDLPQIVEYDAGYFNDAGTFVPHIADTQGILVGPRMSGATVGEYKMTRNANNPDLAPGSYSRTIDRGENEVPRTIEQHRGHNGGPCIFFPGSIVALTI